MGQRPSKTSRQEDNWLSSLEVAVRYCFPMRTDTNDFEGTLVVEVTGGEVAATALELGNQPGQFTTLPVTPLQ